MASKIGEAFIDLKGNLEPLKQDLKKAERYTLASVAKMTAGVLKSGITKAFRLIGKSIQFVINKLKTLWKWAAIAYAALSVYLVKVAGDAVESENLYSESLRGMADSVRIWSEEMAKAFGLNAYEVRRNVGVLKVMIESMGLSAEGATAMSKSITKLTYDMASFYNIRVDEAFDKIRSGLVGMPRALQDLGIIINETAIQTWALKKGLIAQGEAMTTAQKVVARYGALLEATSVAQGDLARTSDQYANVMRSLRSVIKSISIQIGEKLLPAVTGTAMAMREWLMDNQAAIVSVGGKIIQGIGKIVTAFFHYAKKVYSYLMANSETIIGWAKTVFGAMKYVWGIIKKTFGWIYNKIVQSAKWWQGSSVYVWAWAKRVYHAMVYAKDVLWSFLKYMKDDWRGGLRSVLVNVVELFKATGRSIGLVLGTGMQQAFGGILRDLAEQAAGAFRRLQKLYDVAPNRAAQVMIGAAMDLQSGLQKMFHASWLSMRKYENSWGDVATKIQTFFADAMAKMKDLTPPDLAKAWAADWAKFEAALVGVDKRLKADLEAMAKKPIATLQAAADVLKEMKKDIKYLLPDFADPSKLFAAIAAAEEMLAKARKRIAKVSAEDAIALEKATANTIVEAVRHRILEIERLERSRLKLGRRVIGVGTGAVVSFGASREVESKPSRHRLQIGQGNEYAQVKLLERIVILLEQARPVAGGLGGMTI